MENNENLVTEQVAENAEQTAEQTPQEKTFTQKEVEEMMGKRLSRQEAKLRREYDRKYGALEEVAKAGTGKNSLEDAAGALKQFYTAKGIPMPEKPAFSQRDIEVLAKSDAEEIIRGGYEEVVEETDRLSAIGAANMTEREKALFKALAQHRQNEEQGKELDKLGVTAETRNSKAFREFVGKFNPSTPIAEIYEIYTKTQPKKEVQTMGSMKHTTPDTGVKDFYTRDEALKFTKQDFDRNPELFRRVQESMLKW